MHAGEKIEKVQPSFTNKILGNTFSLIVAFGLLSFLTAGPFGILVISFLSGIYNSLKSVKKPFLSGFLPPIFASFILQLFYFLSATDIYPPLTATVAIFVNLIPITIFSAIGAGIGSLWLKRRKRKIEVDKARHEKAKSDFARNVQRLSVWVLFMYLTMHVFVPFAARVSAAEKLSAKQTVDSFFENYDEEKKYEAGAEAQISPAGSTETGTKGEGQTGELETWEQAQIKEQQASQKAKQEKLSNLKKKNLSYKEINKLYETKKITSLEMEALVRNGVSTGKVSWWDAAKFYASGVWHAAKIVGEAVIKPVKQAIDWAVKNPWKAAAIVVGVIAVAAAIVFIAPVAAVASAVFAWGMIGLTWFGVAAAVVTVGRLAVSYVKGGAAGVRSTIFSKDTFTLWNSGDLFGAIGSGVVDVWSTFDTVVPGFAAAKLPGMISKLPSTIGKIGKAIQTVREIKQIRIVIVDSMGVLSGGGLKALKNAIRQAYEDGPEAAKNMQMFAFNVIGNKNNRAIVEEAGEEIVAANKVSVSAGKAAAKEQGEKIVKEAGKTTPNNTKNFKVDIGSIPTNASKAASSGTLPRPSENMEVTYEQLVAIEKANQPNAHGIEKHVEKTNEELEKRLLPKSEGGDNVNIASTFNSKEIYVEQVNNVLKTNHQEINKWLKDPTSQKKDFSVDNKYIIGRALENNKNYTQIASKTTIILKKNNKGGYYILTNFVE